ncbi:hypothetical protein MOB49_18745 [Bacillus haynesii]|uniref:hypothetical protein n=1 Tax=Bacillus haynesii TaxID=1925021 RepID=UPI0012B92B97|nr:hypothetical protein [Bacillus haynesii]TWK25193.1 hypothetical protein CHCC20375_2476 [Bacillus licheniformis]MCY7838597.1 hypothetical protein [Bacillus haynesii]MCY7850474.1 hypothetical protein [Bacillus haynesii]MCY7969081.1 hypothetical protein [Bacillus haynesii]MCY7990756.1 hypothetical protein [Bacillus haynesii]
MPPIAWRYNINRYSNIDQHKERLANELRQSGFANVTVNPAEIYCQIENCSVHIVHYRIDQFQYFEMVMCVCDDFRRAHTIVDRVWRAISRVM